MLLDHQDDYSSQWSAIVSIASKIGCTGETLRRWVRQAERDQGLREGTTTEERDRLKALERENQELRHAVVPDARFQRDEILRKASAYFAQAELDRPFKR
jgi:transposase-like protein